MNAGWGEFGRAMWTALAHKPRAISPKFFYDAAGSALFDRICELPEYYPTRTEMALLDKHAPEIAERMGADADIVEFGAGSATKVRVLLDALQQPRRYCAIDISAEHLHDAAAALRKAHPGLEVQTVVTDYTQAFELPPQEGARRAGFFPGSSIGNFSPPEALRFLRRCAIQLRGGGLLVGVDLIKDPAVLHAAYNDAAGVTAAFNRNLLVRANRELGADFDVERFAHYAYYDPRHQRIEMHLLSLGAQQVTVAGRSFDFADGESLHTENSYKYSVESFQALCRRAGFVPRAVWCDAQRRFSLHWLDAPREEGA